MTAFFVDYAGASDIGLLAPCAVTVLDVSRPIEDLVAMGGYQTAMVVFTDGGEPFGTAVVPVHGDRCRKRHLVSAAGVFESRRRRLLLRRRLSEPVPPDGIGMGDFTRLASSGVEPGHEFSPLSVIVPTRDRPSDLDRCLASILRQANDKVEIIVVDSAPSDDRAFAVTKAAGPGIRYHRLAATGASRARNAGAGLASHEFLVFVDDDVRLGEGCLSAISQAFGLHPNVAVVTGLVLPDDMITTHQARFEAIGGFGRGFERRWIGREPEGHRHDRFHVDLAGLGVGACCAVRKTGFSSVGGFCERLGPGSDGPSSGDDVDLFYRLVESGGLLVYQPSAMAHHRHRLDEAGLENQIADGAVSAAWVWRSIVHAGGPAARSARRAYRRYRQAVLTAALRSTMRRDVLRRRAYWRVWALLVRSRYLTWFRPLPGVTSFAPGALAEGDEAAAGRKAAGASVSSGIVVKVVRLDLSRGIPDYIRAGDESAVEFLVFTGMRFIGRFRRVFSKGVISRPQIVDSICDRLDGELAGNVPVPGPGSSPEVDTIPDQPAYLQNYSRRLAFRPEVSVVVPTRDRPLDLDLCLSALARQDYDGPIEFIIVDNNPESGLTRPVVERYPFCRYESCCKTGAAAARNHGFGVAKGKIIAITDDDVLVPPTWVRQIVSPFWRQDIWMVTGSILPNSLKCRAEQEFESYGAFDFFPSVVEASARWFRGNGSYAIPVWQLGASANMAFRKRIIEDDLIGPMREHLGPGTPAGAGEDPYFVYRLLKEGHTVRFDPSIWVSHRHRSNMDQMYRQIHNYGKSLICFQLETLFADGDLRSLRLLFVDLPIFQIRRMLGPGRLPWGQLQRELSGYLAGVPAYALARFADRDATTGESPP